MVSLLSGLQIEEEVVVKNEFQRSMYISTLEKHGYIEARKIYEISKEGVREKLHNLLEDEQIEVEDGYYLVEKEVDETRILLRIEADEFHMEEVYLVNPVFMALIIEDYECAEQLLDKGYQADDRILEPQIYMVCRNGDIGQVKEYEVSITQWLFAKLGIPEQLFKRICNILNVLMPIFSFSYDYFENPFYESTFNFEKPVYKKQPEIVFDNSSQENVDNDIFGGGFGSAIGTGFGEYVLFPTLDGFEKIYNMDSELLDGMLDEDSLKKIFLDIRDRSHQKWISSFIKYFAHTDDMIPIIKMAADRIMYCQIGMSPVIVKILSEIKTACEYHSEAQTLFFHELIKWFERIKKQGMEREIKPRIRNNIKQLIREAYPEEYDLEAYIEFIYDNYEGCPQVLSYINIWKEVLKKEFSPLWVDMGALLDKCFEETGKHYQKPLSLEFDKAYISQLIDMVELLDGVTDEGYPIEEDLASFSLLVDHIIEVQSEELLLLCVEKNLLPREYLTPVSQVALERGYTKLIPSIIYMQSQENAKKSRKNKQV